METSENLFPGDEQPRKEKQRSSKTSRRRLNTALWNGLTLLVLLAVIIVAMGFLVIFLNPNSAINPFPPPTLPALLMLPSSTPAPEGMQSGTDTPFQNQSETPTETASPTATPTITLTPTATFEPPPITVSPSPTLRATATPGGYAFVPQEGSPDAIPYSIYSDVGCNYLGVGGRVLGLDGSPVTPGVIVRLMGRLNGQRVSIDTLSGTATQYGESGFAFNLADHPIASRGQLSVQLLDQAYLPMSDRITFDTYEDCARNLIFITFRQMR